jgi:3',5'-cyclic-AMP phosphodiesterase
MKIAHISDLHLDKTYKRANYHKTVQLLEYIADSLFDHVIISGDITENAEVSAFEIARKLFKKYGLLNSKKLTLNIGNHDIYGGVHLAEDVLNFPKKCKSVNYDSMVTAFENVFNETFSGITRLHIGGLFPFIKEFDEFILVNLNSIAHYSMLKNPFASNGRISEEQMESLEEIFHKHEFPGKHRIVATHHHFNKYSTEEDGSSMLWQVIDRQTMKLRNKKSIIKRFKKLGISHVLHGHIHENTEYNRKNIKFINAGGAILQPKQDIMAINCMNIGKEISNEFINLPADEKKTNGIKKLSLSKTAYEISLREKDIYLN